MFIVKTYYTRTLEGPETWVRNEVTLHELKESLEKLCPDCRVLTDSGKVISQGWGDGYQIVQVDIHFSGKASGRYTVYCDVGRARLTGKPLEDFWAMRYPSGGFGQWKGDIPKRGKFAEYKEMMLGQAIYKCFDEPTARLIASKLIDYWFKCEPFPDGEYRFTVKMYYQDGVGTPEPYEIFNTYLGK